MEALVNFQTMVCDLTGMPIANASMLDEATAAAEAMTLAKRCVKSKSNVFVVAGDCHPQTIEVIQTRAEPLGIDGARGQLGREWMPRWPATTSPCWRSTPPPAAALTTCAPMWTRCTRKQAAFIVAADLLALTLLMPPGEFGADIVVGTTQRFGMPMGDGGPHAAYMACRDEFKRSMPGRLVGVSVDAHGNPAYRLALQTREQHIRREKATSNICTAQVLPAVVASMYAVYHGPQGLKRIAAARGHLHRHPGARACRPLGYTLAHGTAFDTLTVKTGDATKSIAARALSAGANLRICSRRLRSCISLDETTTRDDIALLWSVFAKDGQALPTVEALREGIEPLIPAALRRTSAFLTHPVFNTHHSETGMLRYIRTLWRQGPGAGPQHDPAGQLHHEAQRHQRDDSHHLARVRQHPPLCPRRPAPGLRRAGRAAARLAVRRPRATPASACSPTPAPRANTPACWSSRPSTRARARATATSA